jgi:hypothetical protein
MDVGEGFSRGGAKFFDPGKILDCNGVRTAEAHEQGLWGWKEKWVALQEERFLEKSG